MEKKNIETERKKPELPNCLHFKNEITCSQFQPGPKPEVIEKLTLGRSESAKQFMEKDVEMLHASMQIKKIEPNFLMKNPGPMKHEADLRTGNVNISVLMPKHAGIEDARIPMHPELALNAAMKKLNSKTI